MSTLISDKTVTIEVCERALLPPLPGSAAPRHDYVPLFTVRARCKTSSGVNEYAQVVIDGQKVTHTYTIRWTSIPFDTRHRVRSYGQIYRILNVMSIDEDMKEMRIQCAAQGDETQEANQ